MGCRPTVANRSAWILGALLLATPALALPPTAIRCFLHLRQLAFTTLFADNANSSGEGSGPGGLPFTYHTIERLGLGTAGAVYRGRVSGLAGWGLDAQPPFEVAIKFGHRVKGTDLSPFNLTIERQVYDSLLAQLPKIESDPQYPKDPGWKQGRIPTLPVIGPLITSRGTVLIKPLVKGGTLKDIQMQIQSAGGGQLPTEMKRSLREIFQFAQAANRAGTLASGKGGAEPIRLDINPTNLVWVSDPVQMERYGLTRPGFIAYEFDQLQPRVFEQIQTPEAFEQLFLEFVQGAF